MDESAERILTAVPQSDWNKDVLTLPMATVNNLSLHNLSVEVATELALDSDSAGYWQQVGLLTELAQAELRR